jgi:TonB family protein
MKKILAAIIFCAINFTVFSQDSIVKNQPVPKYVIENGDTIYIICEKMPTFPGGEDSLMSFLEKNIKYPADAKANKISGRVYVSFIIGKNGKVTNPKILRGKGYGMDEEVIRVVKLMPAWNPGMQDGKAIATKFNLPVSFTL